MSQMSFGGMHTEENHEISKPQYSLIFPIVFFDDVADLSAGLAPLFGFVDYIYGAFRKCLDAFSEIVCKYCELLTAFFETRRGSNVPRSGLQPGKP